jgi:hypothetical protein
MTSIFLKNRFSEWQNEEIVSYKYGSISRRAAIRIFIKEAYSPLIFKNGYFLSKSLEIIENTIASILFYSSINKYYDFYIPTNNDYDEHWQHFNNIISYDEWNGLLHYWDDMFDGLFLIKEGLLGDLIILAYQYTDLEKSSRYLQYLEENYNDLDDDPISKKEKNIDPYILDQMNKYTTYKNSRKDD